MFLSWTGILRPSGQIRSQEPEPAGKPSVRVRVKPKVRARVSSQRWGVEAGIWNKVGGQEPEMRWVGTK